MQHELYFQVLWQRESSLDYFLWPLKVLPVGALQLHYNGKKISVAAFGQREKLQGNGASHLPKKLPGEMPVQQKEVKERTVVSGGNKGGE